MFRSRYWRSAADEGTPRKYLPMTIREVSDESFSIRREKALGIP